MKKLRFSFFGAAFCVALMLALAASPGHAQSGGTFDLSWSSIDSGGGILQGGVFRLAGAVGQPEAAAELSGGVFTLAAGFLQDSSYFPVPVTVSGFSIE